MAVIVPDGVDQMFGGLQFQGGGGGGGGAPSELFDAYLLCTANHTHRSANFQLRGQDSSLLRLVALSTRKWLL